MKATLKKTSTFFNTPWIPTFYHHSSQFRFNTSTRNSIRKTLRSSTKRIKSRQYNYNPMLFPKPKSLRASWAKSKNWIGISTSILKKKKQKINQFKKDNCNLKRCCFQMKAQNRNKRLRSHLWVNLGREVVLKRRKRLRRKRNLSTRKRRRAWLHLLLHLMIQV